jgi:hypothetical protein
MNDDFIYRALPEVPKEFAESLYAKISTVTPALAQRGIFPGLKGLRRTQVALIALAVLLLVAWSQLRFWVRYVPVGDLWLVEFNRSTQLAPGEQPAIPFVPSPLPTPRFYDPTQMSTAEFEEFMQELAQDYVIYIPSWIPEGFHDLENLHEMMFWDSTIWIWSNDVGEKIRLFSVGKAGGMRPYAPKGMWEEVRVNGQPAILIHGRLATTSAENPQTPRKWDETLGLQLYWDTGKYIHVLETYGAYVSEKDLIRMAESAERFPVIYPTP